MTTFFHGKGKVIHFYGDAPTEREDGSPLGDDVDHYTKYFTLPDGSKEQVESILDGREFTNAAIEADVLPVGTYSYYWTTTDVYGDESKPSVTDTFMVSDPLALPNPPTNLAVG